MIEFKGSIRTIRHRSRCYKYQHEASTELSDADKSSAPSTIQTQGSSRGAMTDQSTRTGIWDADLAFEKLIEKEPFELREHARYHFYPNYRLPGGVDIRAIPSDEYRRILSVVRGALEERDAQSKERVDGAEKRLHPPFDEETFATCVSDQQITNSDVIASARRILLRQSSETCEPTSLPPRPQVDVLNMAYHDMVEALLKDYYKRTRGATGIE